MAEGNAVSNVIDKIALSHPEIAITYIREGKQALHTAGDGKLLSAIYAVYGREFANALIPVDYTLGGIRVSGYLSRPENARPNRNMQNFFINNRYVISKTAMAAITEACKGVVMVGKFPSCVLNIELSYNAVDVNVHPTKLEVRFVNERPVFDAVYHAVKTALQDGEQRIEASLNKPKTRINPFELAQKVFRERDEQPAPPKTPVKKQTLKDQSDELLKLLDEPVSQPLPAKRDILTVKDTAPSFAGQYHQRLSPQKSEEPTKNVEIQPAPAKSFPPVPEQPSEPAPLIETDDNSYRYIGEAFKTYVIIEKNPRELLLIDKHAAHERIIYEKLKREKGSGYSQLLLTPVTVTLNKLDYHAVISDTEVFAEAGFEIGDFGSGTIIVRAVPQYLPPEDIEDSVIEMAGYLSENKKEIRSEKMDWIYHNVSCRAAIKGGNASTDDELIALAKQVEDEDVRHCPHGRPVCVVVKKRELERWFGRV